MDSFKYIAAPTTEVSHVLVAVILSEPELKPEVTCLRSFSNVGISITTRACVCFLLVEAGWRQARSREVLLLYLYLAGQGAL